MKIKATHWFSPMGSGIIGIVVGEDDVTGETKAYIGVGTGESAAVDSKRINEWGAKITPERAKELIKDLEKITA